MRDCQHHDETAETLVERLVALAAHDPEKLSEILEGLCPGCKDRALSEYSYQTAGFVLARDFRDEPDEDRDRGCRCTRPAVPEVAAMALTLSADSRDAAALVKVLEDHSNCPACLTSIVLCQAVEKAEWLNETNLGWRPQVENDLRILLDERDPVCRPVEQELALLDWKA